MNESRQEGWLQAANWRLKQSSMTCTMAKLVSGWIWCIQPFINISNFLALICLLRPSLRNLLASEYYFVYIMFLDQLASLLWSSWHSIVIHHTLRSHSSSCASLLYFITSRLFLWGVVKKSPSNNDDRIRGWRIWHNSSGVSPKLKPLFAPRKTCTEIWRCGRGGGFSPVIEHDSLS